MMSWTLIWKNFSHENMSVAGMEEQILSQILLVRNVGKMVYLYWRIFSLSESTVIVDMKMPNPGGKGFQPGKHIHPGADICMAHIQTDTQSGIVYPLDNLL